ncbi:MAG: RadC family protein [Spirochaetia bacterium]
MILGEKKQISLDIQPREELPRERLLSEGPSVLSDADLLSVILGSGIKNKSVFKLAEEVLKILDQANGKPDIKELLSVPGLGTAKAALISAVMETARRIFQPDYRKIRQPGDVYTIVQHFTDRKQEHFITLSLNGAQEVQAVRTVSVGLVNRTIVHPREVFADPLTDRAASIIVAHNHPSGQVEPSSEDAEVTERLKQAGAVLGINLLDHVIFSSLGYYSFLEEGRL